MNPILLSLALLMQNGSTCVTDLTVKCDVKGRLSRFCERHIIADDPRSQEQQQRDDDEEREQRRRR